MKIINLLVILCCVILTACGADKDAADTIENQPKISEITTDSYAEAKQRWLQAGIQHYTFELTLDCYCTEDYRRPMQVEVENNKVIAVSYIDEQTTAPQQVIQSLRTIDQWFVYIEKGLEKPFHSLEVSYHSTEGYPVSMEIDVNERIADDEQTVSIKNLVNVGVQTSSL